MEGKRKVSLTREFGEFSKHNRLVSLWNKFQENLYLFVLKINDNKVLIFLDFIFVLKNNIPVFMSNTVFNLFVIFFPASYGLLLLR